MNKYLKLIKFNIQIIYIIFENYKVTFYYYFTKKYIICIYVNNKNEVFY